MMSIIQGSLGSGKSAVALLRGIQHLQFGGVFACNFNLVDDWAYRLADMSFAVRLGLRNRNELAESYYKRCFKIGSPQTVFDLAEKIEDLAIGWASRQREGKALLVLDEAQLYFNSRDWQKNKGFIEVFSQSRKLKCDILLVAHSVEMIDKQIRFFLGFEETFRNTNEMRLPYTPFPLTPFTGFLMLKVYAGLGPGKGMRHSASFKMLRKEISNMYDSFEVFGFDSLPEKFTHQGSIKKKKRKKAPRSRPPSSSSLSSSYEVPYYQS